MQNPEEITQKITDFNCCILIPTYNNYATLDRVIQGVLVCTRKIIIINDGSTDNTACILSKYPKLTQIHIEKNKGKGNALRLGLQKAEELDFEFDESDSKDEQGELDTEFIGKTVRVVQAIPGGSVRGKVELKGADWNAYSDQPHAEGDMVKVTERDGLNLTVVAKS